MNKYVYDGPVMEFNNLLVNRWLGSTIAPTESKARSNLVYQFKKKYNKVPGAKITLPGKLTLIERMEA